MEPSCLGKATFCELGNQTDLPLFFNQHLVSLFANGSVRTEPVRALSGGVGPKDGARGPWNISLTVR